MEAGYSLGFVAADVDNDGDLDAYVTSFGANRLYRNNGDGTFTDVTETAGIGNEGFGTSATFTDLDRDGDLDLYVANYLSYALEDALYCGNKAQGVHTYCHPDNYDGAADVLYRNEGDGTFTDISAETSVGDIDGKGLGVLATDTDQDGYPDIYVANDSVMNLLFRNLGEGRFEEMALASGLGFSEEGRAEAGMGVDAADFDGDGQLDLFVSNYEGESNTLYRNQGGGELRRYNLCQRSRGAELALGRVRDGFFRHGQRRRPGPIRRERAHHGPPTFSLRRHELRAAQSAL